MNIPSPYKFKGLSSAPQNNVFDNGILLKEAVKDSDFKQRFGMDRRI